MKLRSFSALDALLVGAVLLALIAGSLSLFDNPMGGPLQLALIMVGCCAALIGMKNGIGWAELEREIVATNAKTIGSIFIFLSIGVLIGAFILAGTVPTLLYAGLSLLSPGFFYPLACLICAIVSICIGSSWTTAATIGVGLMGTFAAGIPLPAAQAWANLFTQWFSPAQVNPLGLNPLRSLLTREVDFDLLLARRAGE